MLYYKGFGVIYDEVAKDYMIKIGPDVAAFEERFSCMSYVYDFIDSLELKGEL